MLDTIKENPVPSLIAGLSIGWLVAKGSSSSSQRRFEGGYYDYDEYGYAGSRSRYRGRYPERGSSSAYGYEEDEPGYREPGYVSSRAEYDYDEGESEEGHSIRERAGEAASRARGTAEHYGHEAQYRARRAAGQAERMMDENPLAVGVATLAMGAFAGLMLPRTHAEDRFMGEARDRTVHKAQAAAQETVERAKHVAEKTAEEAKETAKEETQKEKAKARSKREGQ